MYKLIFLSIFSSIILFLPLNAKSTFEGQKIYLKECRTCHLGSGIFINTHTYKEWKKVFDDDAGITLSNIHLNNKERKVKSKDGILKSSHTYFNTTRYKQQYKMLKDFIIISAQKNENNLAINK